MSRWMIKARGSKRMNEEKDEPMKAIDKKNE